jgi:hypothetical protein
LLRLEPDIDPGAGAVRTEGAERVADGALLGWRVLTEPPLDRRGSDGRGGDGCDGGRACGCVSGRDDGREDGRKIGDDPDARGCTRIGVPLLLLVLPPPLPR